MPFQLIIIFQQLPARTKHLEIDCHIVREKLHAGLFKLLLVTSKDQVVDFFTKSLFPQPFNFLLSKLGMLESTSLLLVAGYCTVK